MMLWKFVLGNSRRQSRWMIDAAGNLKVKSFLQTVAPERFGARRAHNTYALRKDFDVEDVEHGGARVADAVDIRCLGSGDEPCRAFLGGGRDPIFAWELTLDGGIIELDGDIIERVLVEEGGVARIDDYIEDADVLIFKDDVVVGLLLHSDGIRSGARSVRRDRGRFHWHSRAVRAFQFDLDVFHGLVGEGLDLMDYGSTQKSW